MSQGEGWKSLLEHLLQDVLLVRLVLHITILLWLFAALAFCGTARILFPLLEVATCIRNGGMCDENKNEADVHHCLHFVQLVSLFFYLVEIVNQVSEQAGPDVIDLVDAYFGVKDTLDPKQRQHEHHELLVLAPHQLLRQVLPGYLTCFLVDVWLKVDESGPRFFELIDQNIPR